ncbi:MAG TPA: hypothetical protein GXX40_09915 [Firmicutes bacterium]|nr:hypothetical protein [Bacillota bacterium]
MKIGYRTPSIKKRIAARTSVKRAIRSKIRAPRGMGWLTNPKKAAYNRIYNRTTKKACYIATAVYGDVDAWQVVRLRHFRDDVLLKSWWGSVLVLAYYAVSPGLARFFGKASLLNRLTRRILDWIINHLR